MSVCGPVNPCYSTLSIPLPLRVNIGLTTCNAILSYACLTPKEPQPLFSSGCVCLCVCDCHSVSTCNFYCLFLITQHPHHPLFSYFPPSLPLPPFSLPPFPPFFLCLCFTSPSLSTPLCFAPSPNLLFSFFDSVFVSVALRGYLPHCSALCLFRLLQLA